MKSNEFPSFLTKATGQGGPPFCQKCVIIVQKCRNQAFFKEAPRFGLTTCNQSENQSFGADDRKETKIEVRTNTNGPKLEQTRCHFGAKWSTFWRKLVQKWGPRDGEWTYASQQTPLLARGLSMPVGIRASPPPHSNIGFM